MKTTVQRVDDILGFIDFAKFVPNEPSVSAMVGVSVNSRTAALPGRPTLELLKNMA